MDKLHPQASALRDLLLRSFDQELVETEAQQLQTALRTEPWLAAEKEQYLLLRAALPGLHPAADPAFTQRVTGGLFRQNNRMLRPLVRLWPAIAVAACIAVLLGLGFIYSTSGSLDQEAILGLDQVELDDVYVFDY